MQRMRYIIVGLLGLTLCSLNACSVSTHHPAPVKKGQPSKAAHDGTHRVDYGETLDSIAWNYGLDPEALAALNGIKAPYQVRPGQRLSLNAKQQPTMVVQSITPTLSSSTKSRGAWVWPAKGPIVSTFSADYNKGIDISGNAGDPIFAARDGIVVYAGQHLRGYGKVILIQHEKGLISAYAHNRDNFVTVGQKVKQSQRIATMGKTDSNAVKLHFEIRHHGAPINPLPFLK